MIVFRVQISFWNLSIPNQESLMSLKIFLRKISSIIAIKKYVSKVYIYYYFETIKKLDFIAKKVEIISI